MAKLPLNSLTSLSNETSALGVLNANFAAITAFAELLLSRNGTSPNTMTADFDMNSNRILNLPAAVSPTEPVRKAEFDAIEGIADLASILDEIQDIADEAELDAATAQAAAVNAIAAWQSAETAADGVTGAAGAIVYTFSTATADVNPGSGFLRLNNATQGSATVIRASNFHDNGTDFGNYLNTWDDGTSPVKGDLRLFNRNDPTKWIQFTMSALASTTGYKNLTASVVAISGSNPLVDGDEVVLSFTRAGNSGGTGSGSGDLLAAQNLADVSNAATARSNLGLAIGTNVQAYDSDLAALSALSSNGIISRTGSGTAAVRTIAAGTGIAVTNGDGVSGNPTIALDINSLSTVTPAAGDFIPIYDISGTVVAKATVGNVGSGGVSSGTVYYNGYTGSSTWTKPSGIGANSLVVVEVWGAGGGGYNGNGGGGGGGAYNNASYQAAELAASETVTVGAGGAAGLQGGTSVFQTCVAYGGGGGFHAAGGGGGGGGVMGTGAQSNGNVGGYGGRPGGGGNVGIGGGPSTGVPGGNAAQTLFATSNGGFGGGGGGGAATNNYNYGGESYAGGGGGGGAGPGNRGGESCKGGGGGAGYSASGTNPGGTSRFGGQGASCVNGSTSGTPPSIPGGGGAGGNGSNNAGAAGQVRIWVVASAS